MTVSPRTFFTGQLAFNTFNTGSAYNAIGPNPIYITFALNPALPVDAAGNFIIQPGVPVFDPTSVIAGPTNQTTDAFTVSRNLRTPYVYNYNLNIQQQLLPNTVLQVGYVGSVGTKTLLFPRYQSTDTCGDHHDRRILRIHRDDLAWNAAVHGRSSRWIHDAAKSSSSQPAVFC